MDILKQITLTQTLQELESISSKRLKKLENPNILEIVDIAIKNRLILRASEEEAQLAQKIFMATSILNLSFEIQEQFPLFVERVKEVINFNRIALAFFKKEINAFDIFSSEVAEGINIFGDRCQTLPGTSSSLTWVYNEKKPLIINDLMVEKYFIEDNNDFNKGLRSGIRVPIIYDEEVIGVLMLNSSTPNDYSKNHMNIAKIIAGQIATVVKNAKLYGDFKQKKNELQKTQNTLKAINELSEIMIQQKSVKTLLAAALKKILALTGRDLGAIYLLNEKKKVLEMDFSHGLSKDFQKVVQKVALGKLNTGKAALVGKTIIVSDLSSFEKAGSVNLKEGIQSAVYIPLKVKKKVIGVMPIASKVKKSFSPEEIELLESLSNYFALTIQRMRMIEKISELATTDTLTELFNRRAFFKELEIQFTRAERYSETFSILMLDIDHFKKFNDTYGHMAGDRILKKLGRIIASTVRDDDIPARYGGEEFAILSYGTDNGEALKQAERIRAIIQEKCSEDSLTISIGVASFPENGIDIETIIKKADEALYLAKNAGRNCVKSFGS